jgi:hypothetical protein
MEGGAAGWEARRGPHIGGDWANVLVQLGGHQRAGEEPPRQDDTPPRDSDDSGTRGCRARVVLSGAGQLVLPVKRVTTWRLAEPDVEIIVTQAAK